MSEVITDIASGLWCLDRDISPQELAVVKADSSGSIDIIRLHIGQIDGPQ